MQVVVIFFLGVLSSCRGGMRFPTFCPPKLRMLWDGKGLMIRDLGTFFTEVTILLMGGSPEGWVGGGAYGERCLAGCLRPIVGADDLSVDGLLSLACLSKNLMFPSSALMCVFPLVVTRDRLVGEVICFSLTRRGPCSLTTELSPLVFIMAHHLSCANLGSESILMKARALDTRFSSRLVTTSMMCDPLGALSISIIQELDEVR